MTTSVTETTRLTTSEVRKTDIFLPKTQSYGLLFRKEGADDSCVLLRWVLSRTRESGAMESNCSGCGGEWSVDGGAEHVSDGLERADRVSACGFDDGPDVGVLFGAPLGAESVGDFSIGGAGAQGALGFVVGRGNGAVGHEDEEVGAEFFDCGFPFDPRAMDGGQVDHPVEFGFETSFAWISPHGKTASRSPLNSKRSTGPRTRTSPAGRWRISTPASGAASIRRSRRAGGETGSMSSRSSPFPSLCGASFTPRTPSNP